ncbi:MAG: ATP phosphoribosyltransferase regulatory subunit, partial [Pelagibacteraceae bacterium]
LLAQRSVEAFKKYDLNYKDKSGKEFSLRPDLTIATAIEYIQSKKRGTEKLSYFGSAFRLNKNGDLKVFDQIGCEIINSKSSPEYLILSTILPVFKKLKKTEILLNDLNLFQSLINSLNLPQRWKLRLIRHSSRKEYFEELLKRLDTNYDLDNTKIKIDYDRLEDLKKMDAKKVIGGRTVEEIIQRFEKKIKDPRDNFKGSQSVKIIKDFLKLKTPLVKLDNVIKKFVEKNNLRIKGLNQSLIKFKNLNKKLGLKQSITFDAKFGRETQYYTGLAFSIYKQNKELARGGEYNNLIKTLGGKQTPAFGAAINIKELI